MNCRTLAFTLSTLAACSIQAYGQYPGLTITSPPQGSVFSGGQHVTITWTGGDPSWNINIALIDYNYYQQVKGVGSPPNTGSFD